MIAYIEEKLKNRTVQFVLLAVITGLAAILRFYKLGEWSFWYDEIFTLRDVSQIYELPATNQQLSRWLIYFLVNAWGTNEFNARLVPALMGIFSIPILYLPTKKMFDAPTAMLFAIFLAIAPWHIYWSQNARFYTTLLIFYTLGLYLVYFGFEEDKPWYLVFALFFFGLAVMERVFAIMLVPVIAAYLVGIRFLPFEKPPGMRLRNVLILLIPTLIIAFVGSFRFIQNPEKWFEGFGWINNNPLWIVSGIIFYIGIPFICLGLVSAVYYLLHKSRVAFFLTIGAILPILLIITMSLFQYAANRYVFVTLIPWLILSAAGIWELFKQSRERAWVLVAGVLLIFLMFPMGENILYYQFQNGNRDNWKGAFELVEELKEPGDVVVVTEKRMGYFYLDENHVYAFENLDFTNLDDIDGRYWFIEDNNLGEKEPETLQWVRENSELIANKDVKVRARTFKMRVYLHDPAGH